MAESLIRVYVKRGCKRCAISSNDSEWLASRFGGLKVSLRDIGTDPASLAEFSMFQLKNTPSVVIIDAKTEDPIKIWEGNIPSVEEITKCLHYKVGE